MSITSMPALKLEENSLQQAQKNAHRLERVTKALPCRHCGKGDWCYRLGTFDVCNRQASPATGWIETDKKDKQGRTFYTLASQPKPIRPKQTRHWNYPARDGSPLVRVMRVDDGQGKKKIWQERWDGYGWVKGLGKIPRQDIPIYRYAEVREAIGQGQTTRSMT